jgi:iron-sulfur cluster assembly protein
LCMITLTPSAAEKIQETIKKKGQEGAGLRVRVVGGGCSGLQYNLDLETMERKGDKVFESNGVKVFVDLKSLLYLKGTEIDFVDALQGGGFKFKNPNAHGSCSCGESFH